MRVDGDDRAALDFRLEGAPVRRVEMPVAGHRPSPSDAGSRPAGPGRRSASPRSPMVAWPAPADNVSRATGSPDRGSGRSARPCRVCRRALHFRREWRTMKQGATHDPRRRRSWRRDGSIRETRPSDVPRGGRGETGVRGAAPTAMTIPTEPIGSIPRPPELIEAALLKGGDDPSLGSSLRARRPRHRAPLRGDGLAGDHRRRAAEVPQLLDLLRARPAQHASRRLPDPVRGRPRPAHAAPHRRALSLPAVCRQVPGGGAAVHAAAPEAGGDLALRAEPHVSGRRASRATRASSSSTICCASTRPRSAAVWTRAPTRCRSTSRRAGSR